MFAAMNIYLFMAFEQRAFYAHMTMHAQLIVHVAYTMTYVWFHKRGFIFSMATNAYTKRVKPCLIIILLWGQCPLNTNCTYIIYNKIMPAYIPSPTTATVLLYTRP